jgi:hypothetical protein
VTALVGGYRVVDPGELVGLNGLTAHVALAASDSQVRSRPDGPVRAVDPVRHAANGGREHFFR